MTRVLITADLHWGCGSKQYNFNPGSDISWKDERHIELFEKMVHSEEFDIFVVIGDIYDTPNPVNTLRAKFNGFIREMVDNGRHVVLVVGNHDMTRNNNALSPLASTLFGKNIHVVANHPETISVGGFDFHCIPWNVKAAKIGWDRSIRKLIKSKRFNCGTGLPVVLGHLPVNGAEVGPSNYRLDYNGVDYKTLVKLAKGLGAEHTFLGHFHKQQKVGKGVYYVGSLDRIDFGERDEDKGYIILDDTGSVEWESVVPIDMILIDSLEIYDEDNVGFGGGIVKFDLSLSDKEAVRINAMELREFALAHNAGYVLPVKIGSIEQEIDDVGLEERRQKFGGTINDAVDNWIAEQYSSQGPDFVDKLKRLASDYLEEE